MKIKSPKKPNKIILILVIGLLAVSAAAFYYFQYHNRSIEELSKDKPNIDYSEATDEQTQSGNETKKQTVTEDQTDDTSVNTKPSLAKPNNSENTLNTYITAATVEDDTLYIRNEINKLTQEGSCSLVLTKDGIQVTRVSGVQALAKSSTCKGFNIPMSELSSGKWGISINVTIGDQSARATGEVSI